MTIDEMIESKIKNYVDNEDIDGQIENAITKHLSHAHGIASTSINMHKQDLEPVPELDGWLGHTSIKSSGSSINLSNTPIHTVMEDSCDRDYLPWSPEEDINLAKELRQAINEIAQKHRRSHHYIISHIKIQKILFF